MEKLPARKPTLRKLVQAPPLVSRGTVLARFGSLSHGDTVLPISDYFQLCGYLTQCPIAQTYFEFFRSILEGWVWVR